MVRRLWEDARFYFEVCMDWMEYFFGPVINGTVIIIDLIMTMIVRAMVIGIILNIIAGHFLTELPEKMPKMYSAFNGALQLGEFIFRNVFRVIAALFTETTIPEVNAVIIAEWKEMFQQFCSWTTQL